MTRPNGTIRRIVAAVVATAVAALVSWAGAALVDHGAQLAYLRARDQALVQWLERLDQRLERIEDALRR